MKITTLKEYGPETAGQIRHLLTQLSRTGKDKGEIPESWFTDIINSPFHDLLIAEKNNHILGFACLSVIMGPGIGKNAYLEDFVTDSTVRGKGIGSKLWNEMLNWATEKGCKNLEFTCGNGREAAQKFYKSKGASIYDTNFFRCGISSQKS